MHPTFRRLTDTAAGAVLATTLLAGGAAAVATGGFGTFDEPAPASVALQGMGEDYEVLDAGTVSVAVEDGRLVVAGVSAAPGWSSVVEVPEGIQVEVVFRNGGDRVDFDAEIDDGQLRARSRDRRTGAETVLTSALPGSPGSPDDDSPSTTIDDSPGTTVDDSPGTTVDDSPGTTIDDSPPASPGPGGPDPEGMAGTTHPVLDAGSVTVVRDGAVLRVTDVTANPGWSSFVERGEAREVEVTFRNGGARVDFKAELEDGEVRIRVRDRRTDTETETTEGSPAPAPTPTVDDSPSTTVDDSPSTTIDDSPSTTVDDSDDAPAPPPAPAEIRTVGSAGGTVTVRFEGGQLFLVAATPAPGYTADIRSGGPDKVEVRFESGDAESRVELDVSGGSIRQRVEDD